MIEEALGIVQGAIDVLKTERNVGDKSIQADDEGQESEWNMMRSSSPFAPLKETSFPSPKDELSWDHSHESLKYSEFSASGGWRVVPLRGNPSYQLYEMKLEEPILPPLPPNSCIVTCPHGVPVVVEDNDDIAQESQLMASTMK